MHTEPNTAPTQPPFAVAFTRQMTIRVVAGAGGLFVLSYAALTQLTSLPYTFTSGDQATGTGSAGGADRGDVALIVFGALMVTALMLSRTTTLPARLTQPRRSLRARCAWLVAGFVLAASAAALSGWVLVSLSGALSSPWVRAFENTGGSAPVQDLIASFGAGVGEELAYVLAPVAALALLDWWRRIRNGTGLSAGWFRLGIVVVFVVESALRFNLHTYQGYVPALVAVVWGAVNVTVYLWTRSVVTIVLAHAFYDFCIAWGHFPQLPTEVYAVAGIVALGAIAAIRIAENTPAPTRQRGWFADGKAWLHRAWRDLRDTDRVGIPELQVSRRSARIAVWTAIIALYWIGWGKGIITAINALVELLQGTPLPDTLPARTVTANLDILLWVSIDACVAAVALACILLLTRTRTPFTTTAVVRAMPLSAVAVGAGFAATAIVTALFALPQNTFPMTAAPDALTMTTDLASSFIAGPAEELALLALPVIGLRAAGYRWGVIFITAAALRVPFHLYYGPGAIALALWAVLMVALVRRLGPWAILGAIATHSAWDILSTLGLAPSAVLKLALWLIGSVMLFRWMRRFDPPKTRPTTTGRVQLPATQD